MTPARESGNTRTSIQVIERMMHLLDALARHSNTASLKQLSADTGLHPSTAHRILAVMVESRIVDRPEPGLYRLGIRLLELGNLVKSRINIRQVALPFMQRVHHELLETVNLSVRQGDEMVYIERTASNRSMMRVVHILGTRAPLHITAVGKIFLLEDGLEQMHEYAKRTGLPRFTANTLVDIADLLRELETISANGYAFDNEEAEKGVSCIGAGIRDDEGRLVAGLSVSAPSDRFDRGWASKVRDIAEEISRAIGFRPGGN
jgi:DNA-binding IclR family transcriptional regulator